MLNEKTLEKFNQLNLKQDLIVEKGGNRYDYNQELYQQLSGVYNLIKSAIEHLTESSDPNFTAKLQNAINEFLGEIKTIQDSANALGNNFDSKKTNIVNHVNRYIQEIYEGKDSNQLLLVSQALKNDYYTKNSDDLIQKTIDKLSSEGLSKILQSVEKAEKGASEVERKVKKIQEIGLSEYESAIDKHITKYKKVYNFSMFSGLLLTILIIGFLLWIKKTDLSSQIIGFSSVAKNLDGVTSYYFLFREIIINLAIISVLSYLLKLSVDTYKQASNTLLSLRTKKDIINGHMLLSPDPSSEAYNDVSKLLLEKTTEKLYASGDGTAFINNSDKVSTNKMLDIVTQIVK